MRVGPGMSTSISGNDGRDEKDDAELEETMRKHRAMLREMKRKHRVSSKILRRVRKRDLYKHQIQQQAFHAFLSDNLTSCASESFYSGSMYSAMDQFSVGTPNRSILISETPSKRQGSVASFSPSFAASAASPSLSCSPSHASSYASTYSSGFPYAIEDSASVERERSWKHESELQMSADYKDEDFSRLFRRDRQKHKRKPRPKQKTTAQGLASVREVVEIDEDGDAFYSSLEVEIEDEKEFVESFVDCLPIPEEPTPRISNNESRPSNTEDGAQSANQISAQPLEKETFEDTACVPQLIESTEEGRRNEIGLSFSSSISYSNNSSLVPFEGEDKNESLCRQNVSEEIDIGNKKDHFITSIVIENDKDQNENPDDYISRHQPLENDLQREIFQNSQDQPSFIENVEEDESEYFVDTSMSNQVIDRVEEEVEGKRFGASTEIEGESANDDFVDPVSVGQSSEQDVDEHLFRDSVENISHIEKIEEHSKHLTETDLVPQTVCHDNEVEDDEKDENDNPVPNFSDAPPSHLFDEAGETSAIIEDTSNDISRLTAPRITQNSDDTYDGENATPEIDSLEPALLEKEERRKIDNILEGFLEENNTMDQEKSKETSEAIPKSGDISQIRADDGSQFEDARMIEVENHEELMTEPIGDLSQNPISISLFLRQGEDSNLVARSKQIDIDVEDDPDMEVPSQIKDGVKEIDDMLDNFLRSMAEIDDGVDKNDDDNDPNCTEDFIFPSPEKIQFYSPASVSNSVIDTGVNESQEGGNVVLFGVQNCESPSKCSTDEQLETKSSPKKHLASQNESCVIEYEEKLKDHSESFQKSAPQVGQTQSVSTSHEFSTNDSPVRTRLPSDDLKSAFTSPARSAQKEHGSPLSSGDRESVHTSPARKIATGVTTKDDFHSLENITTEPTESSCDNELFMPKAEKEFVLASSRRAEESISRITSPELNQSLGDNPEIFISKAIEIDSTRPIDPVATALSQHLSGDEMYNTQTHSSMDPSKNVSSDVFSPIVPSKATDDNYSRPTHPIATTSSQDFVEDETESTQLITHKKPEDMDIVNRSIETIPSEADPQSALDNSNTIRKNFAGSPLHGDHSQATTHPISTSSNKSNKEIDRVVSPKASKDEPTVDEQGEASSKTEKHSVDQNVQSVEENSIIHVVQDSDKISAEHNTSNEEINPSALEQVQGAESTANDGGEVLTSNDDTMNFPLRNFDQSSVSTISAASERNEIDEVSVESKFNRPSSCDRESETNSRNIPSESPSGTLLPTNQDDPNKSFVSIATPPPIVKKESALTELLGTPTPSKPPRRPRSATPTKSASPKLPFHRTAERLTKGSPRSELRARATSERSPHRIETSRSPLFLERQERQSSIAGDNTKGWYTSPSRSRRSWSSRQLNNSNGSISTPPTSVRKHRAGSAPRSSSRSKPMNQTTPGSKSSKSTMPTYASPSRSMRDSMTSPLRGMYSLSNPPRSPALALHSRMPKGARSTIRRMQKKINQKDDDENTHTDMLSVDTVRICTHKFVYKIHPKIGPCDRCWALASEEDREIFSSRGSHLRIAKTRSGCQRNCAIFPAEGEDNAPVRLCRPCFFATHQQFDGSSRLQVYRGNHVKVRPYL